MSDRPGLDSFLASDHENDAEEIPFVGDDMFADFLPAWRIVAQGRRPVDHIGRDLLFGSLGRDHRAVVYNRLRHEPPDWINSIADGLIREQPWDVSRHSITNFTLLRSFHARHLALLARSLPAGHRAGRLEVIRGLADCPPAGFLVAREVGDDRPIQRTCGRCRYCPWCHCRKVVRLHETLIGGPCDPAKAGLKILVMAKVRVDDPELDDSEILTRNRVDRVLATCRPQLLEFAHGLGLAGWLLGYQIGPALIAERRSFRHELSILGEVDFAREGRWDPGRFERYRRDAGFSGSGGPTPLLLDAADDRGTVPIEVTAMRMADRKALRWLLAGSPAHRKWGDPGRVRIDRNEAALTHHGSWTVRKNLGIDGALALQPTFLFTADQFLSCDRAMRGRRLYTMFGDWSGVGPEARRGGSVGGKSHPTDGSSSTSRVGSGCAGERDRRRLKEVAPVYRELSRALGKAPGRVHFARALDEAGIELPTRRIVALLEILRTS